MNAYLLEIGMDGWRLCGRPGFALFHHGAGNEQRREQKADNDERCRRMFEHLECPMTTVEISSDHRYGEADILPVEVRRQGVA